MRTAIWRGWLVPATLVALLVWPPVTAQAQQATGSTLQRIEAAHRAGTLDGPLRDLYGAYRVLDRGRLPAGLRADPGQDRPLRCGSRLLRAARRALPRLAAPQRAELETLLANGLEPTPYADSHFSDHFELIVGSNGVDPATIVFWLDTFEQVWVTHTADGGFALPPCTDTQPFRVYLANTGPDVPTIEPDVYGWCDLDGDDCPYVVVQERYPGEPDPVGMAQATAAHEYHHGVQAAYDWEDPDYWVEATAVWAEEMVFDTVNDYLYYINDGAWLSRPNLALTLEDGDHEYGNVLWVLYLAERHGGARAIRRIWERCSFDTPAGAVDGYLQDQGTSIDAAFVRFTAHLATADFVDGSLFDPVLTLADVSSYPSAEDFTAHLPESYGSSYVVFRPAGGPVQRLDVTFLGAPEKNGADIRWGVALVAETAAGWSHQTLTTNAAGHALGGVNSFGGDVERVVLAVSVVGPSGAAPGAGGVPFGYEASLHEDVPLPDGGLPLPDAGPAADARPGPVDRSHSGCGCRTTPTGDLPLPLGLGVLLLLLLTVRRRAL